MSYDGMRAHEHIERADELIQEVENSRIAIQQRDGLLTLALAQAHIAIAQVKMIGRMRAT